MLNKKSNTILTKNGYRLIDKMKEDVSSYAPGRRRLWLFHEANLGNPPTTKAAHFDKFWWDLGQRLYPGCQIALLTFGGETENFSSDARISWHRDHSYAMPCALGISFGAKAIFGYDYSRQSGDKRKIKLAPGTIFQFDCKHLHAVLKHDPGRFSIMYWKLRLDGRYPGLKICKKISSLL